MRDALDYDDDAEPQDVPAKCRGCGGYADSLIDGYCDQCYEPHVPHWTDAWPAGTPLSDIFADND